MGAGAAGALSPRCPGGEVGDGVTSPAQVAQPSPGVLWITSHEGRNGQVRRRCDAIGHPVRRLVRVRIASISDRTLRPGAWRPLTAHEVKVLIETVAAGPRR